MPRSTFLSKWVPGLHLNTPNGLGQICAVTGIVDYGNTASVLLARAGALALTLIRAGPGRFCGQTKSAHWGRLCERQNCKTRGGCTGTSTGRARRTIAAQLTQAFA